MGVDNYTRWHRQHCQREGCMICRTLAFLDNQFEGLDEGVKFEDEHLEGCTLRFCIYCSTYLTVAKTADRANQELREQGHIFEYLPGVFKKAENIGKINKCQACDVYFKLEWYDGILITPMVPSW